MPRIPQHYLETILFIYPTLDDAANNKDGGTAFVLGVPVEGVPDAEFRYFVTCSHILESAYKKGSESVYIRINQCDGTSGLYEIEIERWFISSTDDVAIFRVTGQYEARSNFSIGLHVLMTEERLNQHNIGVEDDVFMIGRFSPFNGDDREYIPTGRFGHIAVMPQDAHDVVYDGPVGKRRQQAYLADMGNRAGFSGSPVFVYGEPGRIKDFTRDGAILTGYHFLHLLGICVGVYHDEGQVYTKDDRGTSPIKGMHHSGTSVMAIIVPISKLLDLLARTDVAEDLSRQSKIEVQILKDKNFGSGNRAISGRSQKGKSLESCSEKEIHH